MGLDQKEQTTTTNEMSDLHKRKIRVPIKLHSNEYTGDQKFKNSNKFKRNHENSKIHGIME